MVYIIVMIEFSENFSDRYEGVSAVPLRATYRLSVRLGEIPYFNGGVDIDDFSYGNRLTSEVRRVLSDFRALVSIDSSRIFIGDISIEIPRSLI